MALGCFHFGNFLLDTGNRQLKCGGRSVELNARYLDALILLVREAGNLISKDRFLQEVWRGVPVTDEALTQCIRMLRRQLGDDATSPRFIETVPKHGYRFIAPVSNDHPVGAAPPNVDDQAAGRGRDRRYWLFLAGSATLGGGVAGVIGGLFYGFSAASQPLQSGPGSLSVLLVILSLTILMALIGAAGVSLGIAAASLASARIGPWSVAGGALGGLIVGAVVKLIGMDSFNLLFGHSPADFTGAVEGLLLGAAAGLGTWLAFRRSARASLRHGTAVAGLAGAGAGVFIAIAGGHLLGSSLDILVRQFPASRLRLDRIGALFGEDGLGPISQTVMSGAEGCLFAACLVGAMIVAERRWKA